MGVGGEAAGVGIAVLGFGEMELEGDDGGMVLPLADIDADEEFVEAVAGDAGGEVGCFGAGDDGAVQELDGGGDEGAFVLLGVEGFAVEGAFGGEKLGVDARAIGGGGAEDGPTVGGGVADAVEDVGLAVGGGERPKAAAGDGEHGGDGGPEGVVDEGGFIDDDGADGGEAADVAGDAGEGDETGAVGEDEGVIVIGVGLSREREKLTEVADAG